MIRFFLFILVGVLAANHATASPLDGDWKEVFSCQGATGQYEELCRSGVRDYFELRLWTRDGKICGFHDATSHLGNRSDDGENIDGKPSVVGVTHGNQA